MHHTNPIGENWLLLRGLSRESAHWGDFLPLLQTQFPTARIHTLDLPGTGRRHLETSPCTLPEITRAVRAEALSAGLLDQPLTVLALSLGGMVAWDWMLRSSSDIAAATLINTSQAGLSPFYQRLRWQSYSNALRLIRQPDRYHRELAVIEWVANRRDHDQTIAQDWDRIQAQRPVRLSNTVRQLVAAARFRPGNAKPAQPILLLNSRGDRLVSPACSEALQAQWQLQLATHPWGGHDLTLDDGAWVAKQLQDWVEGLKNSTVS